MKRLMRASVNASILLGLALSCLVTGVGFADGQKGGVVPAGEFPHMDRFLQAGLLLAATLDRADPGPVARSQPPIHTHRLALTVKEVFQGDIPIGEEIVADHRARQEAAPEFPVGKLCIVIISTVREGMRVDFISEATEDVLRSARAASAVPVGWRTDVGGFVSPWVDLGENAWPAGMRVSPDTVRCSRTGRPALMLGKDVTFDVEPVPPAEKIKWTNPDGDGAYKITVGNPTERRAEVPALLEDGGTVLWQECVIMICQSVARPAPGAKGMPAGARRVTLEPGESVSGVIDAFGLENVEWPRGGYRVEFQFCLGEKSVKHSFYYLSRHHDMIRGQVREKLRMELP